MAIYSNFGYGFSPLLPGGQRNSNSLASAAGFQAGLLDGFTASAALSEGFAGPLGGLGTGLGNPALGLGALSLADPSQLAQVAQLLGGAGDLCGAQGCGAPTQPGAPVELSPGQSFTTPGGCTITWQLGRKSEVDVTEPGGNSQSYPCGDREPSGAFATASGNGAAALACSGGNCGGAPSNCGGGAAPQSWNVHGDPHIKNPNGKNSNFTTKNSLFTLQDGSQVIMCAPGAHGKVNRVQIVPPGGQPNWNGIDPSKTSIMQNQNGMFRPVGTAAQLLSGRF